MIDDRELFDRAIARFAPPERSFERLVARRDRNQRNKRIAAGVVAAVVAVAGIGTLLRAFDPTPRTPISPSPSPTATNGDITFVGRDESSMASVYVLDRIDGTPTRIFDLDPACRRRGTAWCDPWIRSVDWSPDGTRIAYALTGALTGADTGGASDRGGIYVMEVATQEIHRLTRCSAPCVRQDDIEWSPDGSRLAYTQMDHNLCNLPINFAGVCSVRIVRADGSGQIELATGSIVDPVHPTWSPDGTTVAFSGRLGEDGEEWFVFTMALDGSDPTQLAPDLPAPEENMPTWSPDGSMIALLADGGPLDEGLPYELWLVSPDGSERRLLTLGCCRVGGGGLPAQAPEWSPDARQLLIHEASFIGLEAIDVASGDHIDISVKAGGAIAWQPLPEG
jgi:Tol biopolymer transport system component